MIGELEAAVATYPFQESLWELLITALYRAGRQADALTTYQRVRNRLSDELGLEPGPPLQQLEQRILTHDPSLGVPDRRAASSEPGAPGGNLPSMAVELIGRHREIDAVCKLLASSRLVEIVGPGGIGKTALAIATGRRLIVDRRGIRRRLVGETGNRRNTERCHRHSDRRVEHARSAKRRCSSDSRAPQPW